MTDQPIDLAALRALQARGEPIACLTAYDASFAGVLDRAGVDVILVGDSLGMVLKGEADTLGVTVEEMIYHAACVARAGARSWRVVDMPAHSYDSPAQALANARRLVEEGGAQMVKLEGGGPVVECVAAVVAAGIPVCAHLGLTPQSVHELGGYKVQGRSREQAAAILADARALEAAGAGMLVLECVPRRLAVAISDAVGIPTIGIGAAPECAGQVLVLHDLLGVSAGRRPRFVRDFLSGEAGGVVAAVRAYVQAVKARRFPGEEHCYS